MSMSDPIADMLTATMAAALLSMVKEGRRITQVLVFRDVSSPTASTLDDQCILSDISAGRNVIEFTSKAAVKLQNTTPADVTHADAQTCGHDNALNINRNPLDGLVYHFKNAVPKFKMQYLISKSTADRQALDNLSNCYSASHLGVDFLQLTERGTEWSIPPPTPSTIFSNFSGKTATAIPPGGHKSYYMNEGYKGPVNSFFERYFPILKASGDAFEVPPGGSSMMICFKPKYRNATNASLRLEAEIDHTYCARVSRAKLTPLPMNTVLA